TCILRQYHYVARPMIWADAQSFCRLSFTDLATIESIEEMNQLINTVSSAGSDVWIGLYSTIEWRWSDGGYSFRHWDSVNNPLDSLSVICGVADLHKSGKWKLFPCDRKLPFVCYSIPPPGEWKGENAASTVTCN
uniref:C-type lectin domain-containing protein n=1 Tax=Scophthalmus maximus TaxID=52904 RepID=A0A8D2ZTY5_SCOMX